MILMRFAHISDCHLGSWSSHPELAEMPNKAFEKAVDACIAEKLDFIIIAGDLFDTSLPSIEVLKACAKKLYQCRQNNIPVYIIPGSHDFSPTGKTMISVLESAGLVKNVARAEEDNGKIKLIFTKDEKTGANLAGMIGRKGALEKSYFENLSVPDLNGFNIFVFHSAVEEYKPENLKDMAAIPASLLPKGFDYYASGHVHEKKIIDNRIVFPGMLFPTSFNELEKSDCGFFVVEYVDAIKLQWKPINLFDIIMIKFDADKKTPMALENEIIKKIETSDASNKMVLLRIEGILNGSVSEINFRKIEELLAEKHAFAFKKNTNKLFSKEYEEIRKEAGMPIEELEKNLITEHAGKWKIDGFDSVELTNNIMLVLMDDKNEDETKTIYEERIKSNAKKVLSL